MNRTLSLSLPLPITYNKFVPSILKNDYNVGKGGGFNLSSGSKIFKINDRIFNLFSIRIFISKKNIIPGNTNCVPFTQRELKKQIEIFNKSYGTKYTEISEGDKGINFVWNNWNFISLSDAT